MQNKKYLKEHFFDNQKVIIDGIPINPCQRYSFNMTDHEERGEAELNDWWDKPYILIDFLEQEPYIEFYHRMKRSKLKFGLKNTLQDIDILLNAWMVVHGTEVVTKGCFPLLMKQ